MQANSYPVPYHSQSFSLLTAELRNMVYMTFSSFKTFTSLATSPCIRSAASVPYTRITLLSRRCENFGPPLTCTSRSLSVVAAFAVDCSLHWDARLGVAVEVARLGRSRHDLAGLMPCLTAFRRRRDKAAVAGMSAAVQYRCSPCVSNIRRFDCQFIPINQSIY